jgi:DhnA family fructose-bisphosphate aldolase class Ia
MKYFYLGFLGVIIIYFVVVISGHEDSERQKVFDCVHEVAVNNGFAGDTYGRDAYDTFQAFCQ